MARDQLEIKVDEMPVNLLAKAPLASDLRLITIAMKASHDLERACDEATTIAPLHRVENRAAAQALR
jgi:phosphate transport system protein